MNLYNNLKNKVYLGLILVLASIPVHASLETWAQNLDLTIPSLEMPSTSVLDSKAKREIMMGFECCWDQKLIKAVQKEHSQKLIESLLKENPRKLRYTAPSLIEPISTEQWILFTTLQLADIYTTYRGLQYDCVKELNPFLGERPSVSKMFFVKTSILWPAVETDFKKGRLESRYLDNVNLMMMVVVGNNYHILEKSKKYCTKRG